MANTKLQKNDRLTSLQNDHNAISARMAFLNNSDLWNDSEKLRLISEWSENLESVELEIDLINA